MPSKEKVKYDVGDIIRYGGSKYKVLKIWSNHTPRIIKDMSDNNNVMEGLTPDTWKYIDWQIVHKAKDAKLQGKYAHVCLKIQEMQDKRKEAGYAF